MTLTGSWLAADRAFAQDQSQSVIPPSDSGGLSESAPPEGSSIFSGSLSGSGSSGEPIGTAYATADATLRHDSPNTNEGGNPRIRVGARPIRRGLVVFDPAMIEELRAQIGSSEVVYLTLQIAANGNNWSQTEDHYVDVHPLPIDFAVAEGNGRFSGLPLIQTSADTGDGATWHAIEPVVKKEEPPKDKPKKGEKPKKPKPPAPIKWDGGTLLMGPASDGVLHVNGLDGLVSWNVTNDVSNGINAWIVKLRDEHDPANTPGLRKLGFDPFRGSVDYYSREGAANDIGNVFPPMLELVFAPCGSGSQSMSSQCGPGPGSSSPPEG